MGITRVSLSVALLLFPTVLSAEDARGRLPDGRAFRTDAQGLQLIDYTAELELNIETLNRRVQSLEDELAERDRRLSSKSSAASHELQERTLGAAAAPVVQRCPPAPQLTCPVLDCSGEVAEAQAAFLEKAKGRDETIAAYQQAIERQGMRAKTFTEQLARQTAQLSDQASALEAAQSQLVRLQRDNAELTVKLDRMNAERETLVARVSQATTVRESAPPETRIAEPRAALSLARLQAVDSVRGTINRELNELNALLATRTSAYSNRKNRSGPVTFTLQTPRSRTGKTPVMIREEIRAADQMRQLTALRAEIQHIKNLIQEDIALIQRMDRSGR